MRSLFELLGFEQPEWERHVQYAILFNMYGLEWPEWKRGAQDATPQQMVGLCATRLGAMCPMRDPFLEYMDSARPAMERDGQDASAY